MTAPRQRRYTQRRGAAHTAGLIAAGVLALCSAATIGVLIYRASNAPSQATARMVDDTPPPDITALAQQTNTASIGEAIRSADGIYLRIEEDAQLSAELYSNTLDPVAAKRYALEKPRAWIYLDNGRTVHVRADDGRVYMPSREAGPESGIFTGEVDVRVYRTPAAGRPVDLIADVPEARLQTSALAFDFTFGELATPADEGPLPVTVTTADVVFQGNGLRVLLSEIDQRIELLEIAEGESITFTPPAEDESARGDATDAPPMETASAGAGRRPRTPRAEMPVEQDVGPDAEQATTVASNQPVPTATEPVKETLYHATFLGDVRLAQVEAGLTRALTADTLELWARTIDGKLPENAIAGLDAEADTPDAESRAEPSEPRRPARRAARQAAVNTETAPPLAQAEAESTPTPASAEPLAGADANTADAPAPVVLTWTGMLRVVPIESTPDELVANHLFGRFSADEGSRVAFSDAGTGTVGESDTIGYGATSRDLRLTARAGEQVRIDAEQGSLCGPALAVNLGSGVSMIRGAGVLGAGDRGAVSWSEQADFVFATEGGPQNPTMTSNLEAALFAGDVRITDGSGSLDADSARATFAPKPDGTTSLSRLDCAGSVRARDANGASLSAGRLAVDFATVEGRSDPEPIFVAAQQGVTAQQRDARIEAANLEARLARDDDDQITVSSFFAQGDVDFLRGSDRVFARAPQLAANVFAQTATLTGEGAQIGRGPMTISGEQIALDGLGRTVEVFGPGTLTHTDDRPGNAAELTARWASEMMFDDIAGVADTRGDVNAVLDAPGARDTLAAGRLVITLAPGDADGADSASAATGEQDQLGGRRVLGATAYGTAEGITGAQPATLESRRYARVLADDAEEAADEARQRVEQLVFLSGQEIIADNTTERLTVPTAGQLLVLDRREDASSNDRQADDRRGTARFVWNDTMSMDRPSGQVQMDGDVRLTHDRARDRQLTDLECQTLVARLRESPASTGRPLGSSGEIRGELISANARGAVYVQSGEREIIADELDYNAQLGTALARAEAGNVVTAFDSRTGAPVSAERIFWDLIPDRIELRGSRGISSPGPR